jgi:triosephosphate isomerase
MKTPIICGNWKMYKTVAETVKYVKEFRSLVKDLVGVEIALAPPFRRICIGSARARSRAK